MYSKCPPSLSRDATMVRCSMLCQAFTRRSIAVAKYCSTEKSKIKIDLSDRKLQLDVKFDEDLFQKNAKLRNEHTAIQYVFLVGRLYTVQMHSEGHYDWQALPVCY